MTMTRREFLKSVIAAAAASGVTLPFSTARASVAGSADQRMELGALGYTDEAGHAGVRLRWTVPPLFHRHEGSLAYRGLPSAVMVQRARLDHHLHRLPGSLRSYEDETFDGAPELGHMRSTYHPDEWWDGNQFRVSRSPERSNVVGLFPESRTGPLRVAAVRFTVEGYGRGVESVAGLLRDPSVFASSGGVERIIRRVSALKHDGSCLWSCTLQPDHVRQRLDVYLSDADLACLEVHFTSELDDPSVVEGLFLERRDAGVHARWLDLDDVTVHESLPWEDVAEVRIAEPLVDRSELDVERWRQVLQRINGRSTLRVPNALRAAGYAPEPSITREDWDALRDLAAFAHRVALEHLNDDEEHACALGVPREGEMLDMDPWDAFDLLLAERWEIATMAGFGFLDGRRRAADGLETLHAALLDGRPDHDLGYRVVPRYGGPDEPWSHELGSNVAVANNGRGAVPDLVAPRQVRVWTPMTVARRPDERDAIELRIATLTPMAQDGIGPVPEGRPRDVLIGSYGSEVRLQPQPHANAVVAYEHVPARAPVDADVDHHGEAHGGATSSEWEHLRFFADPECAGSESWDLVATTERTFVTQRPSVNVRMLTFTCDPWDRISEDGHEIVRGTVVAYRPEPPSLAGARVVSAKGDREARIEVRLVEPSATLAGGGGVSDGVLEAWPPPAVLLAAGDARGRIDVVRRTRPVRRWDLDVLARSTRTLDLHGLVDVYQVEWRGAADDPVPTAADWYGFSLGMFAAGDRAGTVVNVDVSSAPSVFVNVRRRPPMAFEAQPTPDPCNGPIDAIPDRDPCAPPARSVGAAIETYSPALRGSITELGSSEALWTTVHSSTFDARLPVPTPHAFVDGERPAPAVGVELREYAARLTVTIGERTFVGAVGNPVQVVVLPVPPGPTEPFVVLDHGRDVYGRTLVEVTFPGVIDRDGLFEIGWAVDRDWTDEDVEIEAVERLLPGVLGVQDLSSGSSLFELLDVSGAMDETTPVIIGVRRVDNAGQKGPYRIHEGVVVLQTPFASGALPPTGSVDA